MRVGVFVVVLSLLASAPVASSDSVQPRDTVMLGEVLDGISRREGLSFAVTAQAPARIVAGQLDPDEITYAQLHTVLTNNGLAAVAVEDIVNIVPIGAVRQYPLPTLIEADESMADDQWVTWIVRTERANPAAMIPILRPILPQQGHLVAHPDSGMIVIVDRYANARRVAALVRQIDENSPQRQSQ